MFIKIIHAIENMHHDITKTNAPALFGGVANSIMHTFCGEKDGIFIVCFIHYHAPIQKPQGLNAWPALAFLTDLSSHNTHYYPFSIILLT